MCGYTTTSRNGNTGTALVGDLGAAVVCSVVMAIPGLKVLDELAV
jgi:hypothetical protein